LRAADVGGFLYESTPNDLVKYDPAHRAVLSFDANMGGGQALALLHSSRYLSRRPQRR
jgi:hypothetical protein